MSRQSTRDRGWQFGTLLTVVARFVLLTQASHRGTALEFSRSIANVRRIGGHDGSLWCVRGQCAEHSALWQVSYTG